MSYEYYRYCANPPINFFPRALKDLFKEEKITVDGVETTKKKCELKDILSTYEDGDSYTLAGKKFKKIENRIYLDLGKINESSNEYTVTKKVCVGFLAKHDDTYDFMKAETKYYSLLLKCETDNNAFSSYLVYEDQNNSKDSSKPISINLNNSPYKIKELSIVIKYSATNIPDNAKLKIYATYCNISGWSHTFTLDIYRNTENSLDGFKQSSGKDTDFFVLPRVNPSNNQKKCIKQLQIINNQVFARNASLTDFEFVEESGEIEKIIPDPNDNTKNKIIHIDEIMEKNARNSLTAFRYNSETNTGCRSGLKIGELESIYSYNFSNYGHQLDFIEYLHNEYSLDINTLKGIILDRNFLFGAYKDGEPDNKIEGIVNLYKLVVVPFIENLTEQINLFHDFNHEWLSCPKYNTNYKRGPLTIQNGMNKFIYDSNNNAINLSTIGYNSTQNNNLLPTGTIVNFKRGKDEKAFDTAGEYFYRIESVEIQGTRYPSNGEFSNYSIKLSLQDKQACNDIQENSNIGNYNDTSYNYGNYGIPYYMNGMDSDNNAQCAKLTKTQLLSWNESKNNWYSYTNKPNTGSFGIDCSGFIINSMTGIASNKNHYFTTSTLDISASTIGNKNCKQISIDENFDDTSFLTKNDIVFSSNHIAFCTDGQLSDNFSNSYVSLAQLKDNNRQFNICHNYGEEFIFAQSKVHDLYSMKTIEGPFKHWGVKLKNLAISKSIAHIGRIYLWKKN